MVVLWQDVKRSWLTRGTLRGYLIPKGEDFVYPECPVPQSLFIK